MTICDSIVNYNSSIGINSPYCMLDNYNDIFGYLTTCLALGIIIGFIIGFVILINQNN